MKRLSLTPQAALAAGATLVTVALTAAAFWLSYEHLHDVAAGNGLGHSPARAWVWPATVDLFIVAGELLILRAALRGKFDWFAYLLAGTGSLGSIALNVAGVGAGGEPLEYIVAAVPPVAALLAFAALMRQVHDALARVAVPAVVTVERVPEPPARPVIPPVTSLPLGAPLWADLERPKATAAVAAVKPRQVVTEAVTQVTTDMTAAELRQAARRLNRQVVKETGRPVTIDRLREDLHLSRRDAAALRREVVKKGAPA
ncbi:DUF2637 domain-containing protein [Streptomyces sparsus]